MIGDNVTKKKEEREYAKSREEYFREFHRVIAPVVVMKKYDEFKSDDPLHITSFRNNSILEVAETIQDVFKEHGMNGYNHHLISWINLVVRKFCFYM